MRRMTTGVAAIVVAIGAAAGLAEAGTVYGFYKLGGPGADVSSQLSVEVSPFGTNQVDFTFRNAGPTPATITAVYFDDGTLLGIASVISGPGTSFSQGATPPNLPGGENIGFEVTAGFLVDADNPGPHNGVNPGEWLTIRFNLLDGVTYADTLAAIDAGFANNGGHGTLRIGLHVQAIGTSGQSAAFVNTGVPDGPEVPLPGVAAMGFAGLAVVARRRRLA